LSVVYGCIATIFTCTYVSFHPNLPNRNHRPLRIFVAHVRAVFFFLDVLVVSAALQWRDIWTKKTPINGALCVSRGITVPTICAFQRLDSYFMLMGGFDGWARSLNNWSLEFSKPCPEMLAHQLRTQLEVMTLAYAVLNILVYALW
jgi:hypothetical protein